MELRDARRAERFEGVISFVGEDASGGFGIQAGHARFMTLLEFGLARFRSAEAPWRYLALPGALLYFVDNTLYISTRRYQLDTDYGRICHMLEQRMAAEERELGSMKESLRRMQEELLRRMWELR